MHSEKRLKIIVNLLFDVVKEVQIKHRGIAICQNRLYQYLDENNYDYGFCTFNGRMLLGGGHKMDFGVRRNLFRNSNYFYIHKKYKNRFYIGKTTHEFIEYSINIPFNSMAMLDIWNAVESDLIIENRNEVIDEIIEN